jgi:dinuclear metal center YbgI/SA1388 family protein
LIAYHLPLDAHPELGNNARLARILDLQIEGGMEPDNPLSLGLVGRLPSPMSAEQFADYAAGCLGREVMHVGESKDEIETIAWCTGAAQGFIERAQQLGVDAYLSGEISEPTTHVARETGIHYFAAGHHATERYGVQALGEWLAQEYGLEHIFIDIDNPV